LNKATDALACGSMPGASDIIDSANPQAIGGGYIVIHK
jgi:hypothetical protein